eukprot:TRINITY_DN18050_c0_g1_i1.p1 TRINITY_DN18050_c0_g1~~TRINITY_DN18050_c0_g1_i1.p1  ORF type:complete len:348 (-),score=24.46 TRINITY_DN18050_c0_g1_i1:309-1352(-)
MTQSTDGQNWHSTEIALKPGGSYDKNSVCDPSIVKFKGSYFLYHTCINVEDPPDGYTNNRICLAISDHITGPFYKLDRPVIQDLSCPKDPKTAYCIGQPSALVHNDKIYVYYSSVFPLNHGSGPPNEGYVLLSTTPNGVSNWQAETNRTVPSYTQRDVDIKFDRSTKQFLMFQGDVGSNAIYWSAGSGDGKHFLPFTESRKINTNPNLPQHGTDNNPGVAGLPDGTLGSGSGFVAYGSNYVVGWGKWHLYRTSFINEPAVNNCSFCAGPNGCDFACQGALRTTAVGKCAFPFSIDPAKCCSCTIIPTNDCSACAEGGCAATCAKIGHHTGYCDHPGSRDPSRCCACV